MRIHMAVAAVAALAGHAARAQQTYGYEVVSIHRAPRDQADSGFRDGPQGGMRALNVTVVQALAFSCGVEDYQVLGAPAWAKSERFEITFTPDRSEIVLGQKTSRAAYEGWRARQQQRMQAVLRDRFALALHEETRELPSYVLTIAKGGHKLRAPAHPQRSQSLSVNEGRHLIATNASMKELAGMLSMVLGHPGRNETGLDAAYDFQMDWDPSSTMRISSPGAAPDPSGGPSIFTALTEKLGLRLDSKKAPVTVFVVDRIERPSEN
jgi:uncharacterized protein (TIGR03435 family)